MFVQSNFRCHPDELHESLYTYAHKCKYADTKIHLPDSKVYYDTTFQSRGLFNQSTLA